MAGGFAEQTLRAVAIFVASLIAVYLLVAYVVLPAWWRHHERQPGLAEKPMLTTTTQGIPGDPINIALVGAREEVLAAFAAGGWNAADALTLASAIKIGLSVVLDRRYADAPVSTLLYDGRAQDLAFERAVGLSAERRHHARLWRVLAIGAEGREVWLGAASFDAAVGVSHDTGQITHHIAPDVDAERDLVIATLRAAGAVQETYQVTGIGPTLNAWNGEGDRYFTDGDVTVGVIRAGFNSTDTRSENAAPRVPDAPTIKQRLWRAVVAVGKAIGLVPSAK